MIYVDGSSAALALITILFIFFIYLPYSNRKTRENSIKKLKNDVVSGKKSLSLIDYALLDKKDIEKALEEVQTAQKSATNLDDKKDEFLKDYLSSYNYKNIKNLT